MKFQMNKFGNNPVFKMLGKEWTQILSCFFLNSIMTANLSLRSTNAFRLSSTNFTFLFYNLYTCSHHLIKYLIIKNKLIWPFKWLLHKPPPLLYLIFNKIIYNHLPKNPPSPLWILGWLAIINYKGDSHNVNITFLRFWEFYYFKLFFNPPPPSWVTINFT